MCHNRLWAHPDPVAPWEFRKRKNEPIYEMTEGKY